MPSPYPFAAADTSDGLLMIGRLIVELEAAVGQAVDKITGEDGAYLAFYVPDLDAAGVAAFNAAIAAHVGSPNAQEAEDEAAATDPVVSSPRNTRARSVPVFRNQRGRRLVDTDVEVTPGGAVSMPATLVTVGNVNGRNMVADGIKLDGIPPGGGGGAGGVSIRNFSQTAHGFTLVSNQPIPVYVNNLGLWVAARADDNNTLKSAFVVATPDVDTLRIQQSGFRVATAHGLTVGQHYYLSQISDGLSVLTEPTRGLSEILWRVVDADTLLLIDNRAIDLDVITKYQALVRNTDITTNLNLLTETIAPVGGTTVRNDQSFYSIIGDGVIQIDTPGRYECKAHIHTTSAATRPNLRVQLFVNGDARGSIAATGYIRNSADHNEASHTVDEVFELVATDLITVRTTREAAAGVVTMAEAGTSYLRVTRQ